MKPTDELHASWETFGRLVPFNIIIGGDHLRVLETDPFPEKDAKGRMLVDGWKMSWEGTIPPEWDNGNGTMHGAASAWIVDTCTSAAILIHATDEFWGLPLLAGVSLAINMTYFQPAMIGTEIIVEVEILKCSATTANFSCNILEKGTRQLLASGTHLKAWRSKTRANWILLCPQPRLKTFAAPMKPTDMVNASWEAFGTFMPFNAAGVKHLRVLETDPFPEPDAKGRKTIDGWKMSWEGTIPAEWDNGNGSMHGAAAAWVVDVCTSAAIMIHTTDEFWGPPLRGGVSLAINMTYFHPAIIGSEIVVEVETLKCSATTANFSCNILDKKTRQLLAAGTHLKAWRAKNRAKL